MVRKMMEKQNAMGLAGGEGAAILVHWTAENEKCPNLEQWATITMEPGSTVGNHYHHGEAEVYRVISGEGVYNDNGTDIEVCAGDIMVCYNGEQHGLKNTGVDSFVFDAIIIKG